MKRPKEERDRIEQLAEFSKFLDQSHISDKNIARLKVLVESPLHGVADMAKLVLEVALLYPHKKRRYIKMAQKHKELLAKMEAADLLPDYYYDTADEEDRSIGDEEEYDDEDEFF